MMKPKIIKTEEEYEAALAFVYERMDAAPSSPEEEELELFGLLIENYEAEHYPVDLPDPVDAILFRMEQEGLTRKDLVRYIGSQSKVSEVLNRKRPLSLAMIRALHEGLGIPAEVLLQEPGAELHPAQHVLETYPFVEMFKLGYFEPFEGTLREAKAQAEELLRGLFAPFEESPAQVVFCRRSEADLDLNALLAWQSRCNKLALAEQLPPFQRANLSQAFLLEAIRLSSYSKGPQIVRELLNHAGIHLIILPHLPRTRLDGACFIADNGQPVIGLTLRHDRLDNFWFTLAHELGHLFLHLDGMQAVFFDDTEQRDTHPECWEEQEANAFAQNLLIPPEAWQVAAEDLLAERNDNVVVEFARQLRIAPAIVAGRVRWETSRFNQYDRILGHRQVRDQFPSYHTTPLPAKD